MGYEDIDLVYLFGSHVRDTVGPLSDIDVGVLFKEGMDKGTRFDRVLQIMGDVEDVAEKRADVVDIESTDNPVLLHGIVLQGIPILVQNTSRKAALERYVLRFYEDTRHLRETSYAILERKIKERVGRKN